jgi:DNA-binding NarL/FixJ family response regulator
VRPDWLPQGRAACRVLDVQLEAMSGLDLQDKLAVPIIFITTYDDAETIARIEKSGALGVTCTSPLAKRASWRRSGGRSAWTGRARNQRRLGET